MTDYQPGDTVPRQALQEGWRVRVEFEGVVDRYRAVPLQRPGFALDDRLAMASRIVLLDKPGKSDPDAEIVEPIAELLHDLDGDDHAWADCGAPARFRDPARRLVSILREKGILS